MHKHCGACKKEGHILETAGSPVRLEQGARQRNSRRKIKRGQATEALNFISTTGQLLKTFKEEVPCPEFFLPGKIIRMAA